MFRERWDASVPLTLGLTPLGLTTTMVAHLDHITVIARSLETGSAYVEAALGVQPGAGRAHPGMATHNLLLALGPTVYLEVISPDPRAAPLTQPRWFGLDPSRTRPAFASE